MSTLPDKKVGEEYKKLSDMANTHIEKIKSTTAIEDTQTLAAAMFIQSHKNYIRVLFKNEKIRKRQDAAVKFIHTNIKGFNEDVIRWELTKIGIPSHNAIIKNAVVFLNIPFMYVAYNWYQFASSEHNINIGDALAILLVPYVAYALISYLLVGLLCSSRLPLFLYKRL